MREDFSQHCSDESIFYFILVVHYATPSSHNCTSFTSRFEARVINFLGSTSAALIIAASEYFANINEFIFTRYRGGEMALCTREK